MKFDASGRPDIQSASGNDSDNVASGCALIFGLFALLALVGAFASSGGIGGALLAFLTLFLLAPTLLFLGLSAAIESSDGPDVSLDAVLRGSNGTREKGAPSNREGPEAQHRQRAER